MDQGYLSTAVILISIVLGFLLPNVGILWEPYLSLLLAILMFLVTLGMQMEHVTQSLKQYQLLLSGMATVFILTPLIALTAKPFFSPLIYTGILLAFCCPCAIATSFFTKILNGDTASGLLLSAVTNILSILTIPATLLLTSGTAVLINLNWLLINLAEVLLIPALFSFGLRTLIKHNWTKTSGYTQNLQPVLLLFLIWGAVSPGVSAALKSSVEFAAITLFMLLALGVAFAISYSLTVRLGKQQAITVGVASSIKNGALALVIGLAAFNPQIVLPLVANLVAQILLLVPLKLTVGRNSKADSALSVA